MLNLNKVGSKEREHSTSSITQGCTFCGTVQHCPVCHNLDFLAVIMSKMAAW